MNETHSMRILRSPLGFALVPYSQVFMVQVDLSMQMERQKAILESQRLQESMLAICMANSLGQWGLDYNRRGACYAPSPYKSIPSNPKHDEDRLMAAQLKARVRAEKKAANLQKSTRNNYK